MGNALLLLCAVPALAQAVRWLRARARQRARIARLQPSTYGGIVLVRQPLEPQAVRREVVHG